MADANGTYIFVGLDDAIRNPVPTFADLPGGATPYQIALVEADTSLYYFDPADRTWKSVSSVIGTININTGTTGTLLVSRGGTGSSASPLSFDKIMVSAPDGLSIVASVFEVSDISDLQADVGTLQGEVSTLQADVSTIEADIVDLQADKVDRIASVDNTLPRFDGTTGDLKETDIVVDDNENVTGIRSLTLTGTNSFLQLAGLTTLQRDALTPVAGMIIFNSEIQRYQGYFDAAWGSLHGWGS